jgi:maleate cis-trans isomerase
VNQPPRLKLGVIAAPGWIDPTLDELRERHGAELRITQTILGPLGFDYSFEQIRASESHLRDAALLLAQAGCQQIIQVGPAFAYQVGGSVAGANALQQRLGQAAGVPVILNGVAVLDWLADLQARRVALACPYYNPAWRDEFSRFIAAAGYQIEAFGSFVTQGMAGSQTEVDARAWQFDATEVRESICRTRCAAPHADAVLISGAGIRSLDWIDELSAELGLPLVSADAALYRALVLQAGLQPRLRLDTLAPTGALQQLPGRQARRLRGLPSSVRRTW